MKYIYQLTLSFFVVFFGAQKLNAAHIIGGEITYVCLGESQNDPNSQFYLFRMKVYRDCDSPNGAQFDSAPGGTTGVISVYQGDSNIEFTSVVLSAPEVSPIDNNTNNPCLIVPPGICGETGVYTFSLNLPISDESYHIVYQRCCRNSTINNIFNPGETGATYYVEITPEAQTFCNSSPTFDNLPQTVICVNEELSIDNAASDLDGDQLVYSFCSPLTGGSVTNVAPNPDAPPSEFSDVAFILPNYTPLTPMGGNPVVSIDPFTGEITGTATEEGQFVVGICVEEYRNGVLLSRIQRDYQFNVTFCEPTVNADLEGVDAGEAFTFQSCVDSTITFINESTDEQFISEYVWNFDIPGNQPLNFNTRDITVTFPGPGFYEGMMIVNPGTDCSDTADIEVTITPPINPQFEFEYDTCVAGPVSFTDLTSQTNFGIESWDWSFGDGNFSDEVNPVHEYEDPGLRGVALTVTDTIGCTETVTEPVNWFPAPPIIVVEPSSFVGCPPAEISFENLSTPIDDTYDIRWYFGDGGIDSTISPTYVFNTPGTYDVSIEITSPIGCYIDREFNNLIDIDSLPIADFSFTPDRGTNFEPEVTLTDKSIRAAAWNWRFDEYGSTIAQNPSFVFPDTGLMEIELIVTHRYNCMDTLVKFFDVEPIVTYFLPNAFTPNEDGVNEFFRGGGFFRGIRDFNIKIMNRWGGVVFESRDPSEGWNGRKDNVGRMSPNGVYPVYVKFTGPRGEPREYRGFATLIR